MTNQTSPAALFEFWQDFIRKSSDFWTKAANVQQPPDPAQQWKQFLTMWSDFWVKTFAQTPSPDMFQNTQKLWSEQLETLAQYLLQHEVIDQQTLATLLVERSPRARSELVVP